MKGTGNVIFFVIIAVALVLLFRASRRSRSKLTATASAQLVPGSEIVTRGGILGTVVEKGDEYLLLEIAPGVRIRILPAAVGRIVPPTTSGEVTSGPDDPDLPPPAGRPAL